MLAGTVDVEDAGGSAQAHVTPSTAAIDSTRVAIRIMERVGGEKSARLNNLSPETSCGRVAFGVNQIPITRPVALDVQITVLHPDKSLAAGVPLRVILGTAADWQSPSAGDEMVTGDDGTVQCTLPVVLASQRRQVVRNFVARLMASRESTRQVQLGVVMEYAGRSWLSAITVDRRASGASLRLDPMRVYGRASDGRFTDDVPLHDGSWHKRLPSGQMASLPGFVITHATLDPESAAADNAAWRLRVTLQQWEPHVVPALRLPSL